MWYHLTLFTIKHSISVVMPTLPPEFKVCSSREATCYNGQCIPKDAICDGDYDCDDKSDEERCGMF